MLSLNEILTELENKTKLPRKQLQEKIKQKHEELLGLVSLEGAGHLVARDLEVNLLTVERKPIKIEKLVEGLNDVRVRGRIIQISPIREFERKDKTKGRVCNFIISDGSSEIRIPLWDKQVDMVVSGTLSQGDIIEVSNGFVKKNIYGGLEIVLPKYSQIIKIKNDESMPKIEVNDSMPNLLKKIEIKNAEEGFYEIQGNFVQLFNTNPILQLCPTCRSSLEKTDKGYICKEHGEVKPDNTMIISGIVDDGTSSIRTVFFREQAQKFSGVEPSVLMSLSQDESSKMIKENVLGKETVLEGKIRKNKLFDTLEFVVNNIKELNIEKESKKLIDEIERYGE